MIQEVVVAIIGITVLAILAKRVYQFFFDKSKPAGTCGCSSCHCNVVKK